MAVDVVVVVLRPAQTARVDARRRGLYLQVMYAYSSSCHLRHFQLRHCTVNDVILAQVLSGDGV